MAAAETLSLVDFLLEEQQQLTAGYGYLWDVNRIFGDQGPPATRDYESNSHLARVAYDVAPWFQPVAFAYLLDLRNAPSEVCAHALS